MSERSSRDSAKIDITLFCLAGIPVAAILLFKILKLTELHHAQISILEMLPSLYTDCIFGFIYFGAAAGLLRAPNRHIRSISPALLYPAAFIISASAAIEHAYFTTTGELGTWSLLKYGASQSSDAGLHALLLEQAKEKWLLLILPIAVVALPGLLFRFLSKSITKENKETLEEKRWINLRDAACYVLFGALAVLAPGVFSHGKPGYQIEQNYIVHILKDMYEDAANIKRVLNKSALEAKAFAKIAGHTEEMFDTKTLKVSVRDAAKKKNVIIIVLESTRARSTTVHNPKLQTTPFMAKLAKHSLVADRMYTTTPHTSKALVSILCGIYPKPVYHIIEAKPGRIPGRCLPHLLESVGYETAFFQSAREDFENRTGLTKNMGFEHFEAYQQMDQSGYAKVNYFGYEDRIMINPSLKWIDSKLEQDKPFFITYLTVVSHHSYDTPESHQLIKFSSERELNKYHNALRYQDDFIRDLYAEFEKRNLLESSILILVGDHGEAFGEHKRMQHNNTIWEEGLHIPFLLHQPLMFPAKQRIGGLRQQQDIMPSILDMLNLNHSGGKMLGVSLLTPANQKRKLYFSCWYEETCLAKIQDNLKTIYSFDKHPPEVYHIGDDPLERRSLANTGVYGEFHLAKAKMELLSWEQKVKDIYEEHRSAAAGSISH